MSCVESPGSSYNVIQYPYANMTTFGHTPCQTAAKTKYANPAAPLVLSIISIAWLMFIIRVTDLSPEGLKPAHVLYSSYTGLPRAALRRIRTLYFKHLQY